VSAPGQISDGPAVDTSPLSFEATFDLHYRRIARAIARITGDPSRAEELAMEVFWKFWHTPQAHGDQAGGWLYRSAINLALYELRRRARHSRYQQLLRLAGPSTPEEIHAATEEQKQVRRVLTAMKPRDAELLMLRGDDFSYEELASMLQLNPASVGTLIGRAKEAFRKEYTKLYGEPRFGK
jgi:RNA polymerase sigma-70 factor (ECF subfamily)